MSLCNRSGMFFFSYEVNSNYLTSVQEIGIRYGENASYLTGIAGDAIGSETKIVLDLKYSINPSYTHPIQYNYVTIITYGCTSLDGCDECTFDGNDQYICTKCEGDNYELKDGKCEEIVTDAMETASTLMTGSMAVAGAANVGNSMMMQGDGQGLWLVINMYQMLLMVLLLQVDAPYALTDYLSGFSFATFNLNFIKFEFKEGISDKFEDLEIEFKVN
jgi:hypothetical protein